MTKAPTPASLADADLRLMLAHMPVGARPAVAALFALDETLAQILRTTRQPVIGQMRLTWWHEALGRLGGHPTPSQPVLMALAAAGIEGPRLQPVVEGWEALLEEPLDAEAMRTHASGRGATLFGLVSALIAGDAAVASCRASGEGWALVDLSRHLSDPQVAAHAKALARSALARAPRRWPRRLRPLGTLVKLARHDAERAEPTAKGSPRRALLMLAHRLTGR